MGISQSFWCRALCGLLIVGGLSVTGCQSGPSFRMPTMPSMAWWQKDKAKGDLASRAVEQPQPPSSAFDPPPSMVAGRNQPYGSGYNESPAGYGSRTADLSGSPTYGMNGNTSGVAPSGYQQSPYSPQGTPSYNATAPVRPPYGSGGDTRTAENPYAGAGSPTSYGGGAPQGYGSTPGYGSSNPYGGNPSSQGSVNWPSGSQSPPAGSGGSGTTIPNPYANPTSTGTPAAGFGSGGSPAPNYGPSTGAGQSGATINYPNTGAPAISPNSAGTSGRSLPSSLSQYQGTYTPGSTANVNGSDVRTAGQSAPSAPQSAPTQPSYGGTPTGGGSFQVPGGGSFPGAQPSTNVYR